MRGREEGGEIVDRAGRIRILDKHAEAAGRRLERAVIADDDVDAERGGASLDDVDRLRMARGGDEERAVRGGVALLQAVAHHHRLGRGGALVEHRGVGDLEAGEIGDERLEIEQRFEPALRNFRLIRRVGGIPARVFEDVALDDTGDEGVVIAEPDAVAENLILVRERAQFGERGAFAGGGRQVERAAADRGRQGVVDQRVDRRIVEQLQNLGGVRGVRAGVAAGESVEGGEEVARRCHGKNQHPKARGESRNGVLGRDCERGANQFLSGRGATS